MYDASGGCHCGNIQLEITLSRPPESYTPRACDCDFCCKHAAAYVSDARGWMRMRIKAEHHTTLYRQGSGAAEFLLCTRCGVLAGVLYRQAGRVYGAVNARAMSLETGFGSERAASPKTLAAADKVVRWKEIWFPDVVITYGNS
jgi:hypothetical protein